MQLFLSFLFVPIPRSGGSDLPLVAILRLRLESSAATCHTISLPDEEPLPLLLRHLAARDRDGRLRSASRLSRRSVGQLERQNPRQTAAVDNRRFGRVGKSVSG